MTMKMTCEQFRAGLDAYIDSELNAEKRRAMEEHALDCPDCAALLDRATAAVTMCAELNEGLRVPAEARSAWREALHSEAESAPLSRRARRSSVHSGGRILPRVTAGLVAALVAVIGIGMGTSGLNLDAYRNNAAPTAGFESAPAPYPALSTASKSSEPYWEDGMVMEEWAMEDSVAAAPVAGMGMNDAGGIRLQSDGSVAADNAAGKANSTAQSSGPVVLRSAERRARTKTFDDSTAWLDDLMREYDAYFENKSVDGQAESHNRSLNAVIRVPSEALDDFLTALDEIGTITGREDYAEDITASYTDVAARLSVLRSQLEQLQAMNERAESVTDLVEIHERATELMSEIESYESTIRSWDSRRSYSSVRLYLSETAEIIETPDATLSERMRNAFDESKEWLRTFGQDMAVLGAALLPRLVVIVPVLAIAVVLLCLVFRRKKK